eukprot:TRINITY_DN39108_c0_g1_i1.p1 TRINITY_DN39108_c0_g1~~TRINITY_DN39108_c0_g1_i1.p1  ORF type:complete len:556 (+),score=100.91 TRINITY_DN39108_c0_g1_i1:43-1710(+)
MDSSDSFLLQSDLSRIMQAEFSRLRRELGDDIRQEMDRVSTKVDRLAAHRSEARAETLPTLAVKAEEKESHQWRSHLRGNTAVRAVNDESSASQMWSAATAAARRKTKDLSKIRVSELKHQDTRNTAHGHDRADAWAWSIKDGKQKQKEARASTKALEVDGQSACRKCMQRIVCSPMFEIVVMALIFVNAVLVGAQTQIMAEEVIDVVPIGFRVYDLSYLGVCCAEIAARVYVHRREFFRMWGWQWNVFDLFLIGGQVLEEILLLFLAHSGASTSALMALSWLSIVRLLRSLRVVRVMKVLQHAHDLRLIVSCIAYSVKPLFWSMIVLATMTYIVSLYFTQLVTGARHRADEGDSSVTDPQVQETLRILEQLYGSLFRSVLTLFQGITGGHDWDTLVQPLATFVSPWASLLLIGYILFAIIAVMNVVTGLFVESAIERAQEVRQATLVSHVRSVFEACDLDTSGSISIGEFESHVTAPAVQEYFKAMDIAPTEAKCLFEMLDVDGSGRIDFDEFMHGCLRLQGPARAADLLLTSKEMRTAFDLQMAQLNRLERRL